MERRATRSRLHGLSSLRLSCAWEEIPQSARATARLAAGLRRCLPERRWFAGKARGLRSLEVTEILPLAAPPRDFFLVIAEVRYRRGEPECYLIPQAFASGAEARRIAREHRRLLIARVRPKVRRSNATGAAPRGQQGQGVVYDALGSKDFCRRLLERIAAGASLRGRRGFLYASSAFELRSLLRQAARKGMSLPPRLGEAEQSNSSVIYGDRLFLKLFRRLEPGLNPDLEMSRYLTASGFPNAPRLLGALEYQRTRGMRMAVGILHGFIRGSEDAWEYSLESVRRFYRDAVKHPRDLPADAAPVFKGTPGKPPTRARERASAEEAIAAGGLTRAPQPISAEDQPSSVAASEYLARLAGMHLPGTARRLMGGYLESAWLLGRRTAELHLTLASDKIDKAFMPEAFTPRHKRALIDGFENLAARNLRLLRDRLGSLPRRVRAEGQKVCSLEGECVSRLRSILGRPIRATRIRCHGDLHLGQVLRARGDFFIIDFEGEPARPLAERRAKVCPLRDVAGMLRSFHYAAYASLYLRARDGALPRRPARELEPLARLWCMWASAAFLRSYLGHAGKGDFLPRREEDTWALLESYLLEKAIYELGYELNHRPRWVRIPLEGILQLMGEPST